MGASPLKAGLMSVWGFFSCVKSRCSTIISLLVALYMQDTATYDLYVPVLVAFIDIPKHFMII